MKRRKLYKVCILIVLVFLIVFFVDIFFSSNALIVKNYDFVSEKTQKEIRLVVLSDLHSHEFGRDNQRLVNKVRKQSPDLILLAGDFLNDDALNTRVPDELIAELSEFAPIYFSLGNHEKAYIEKHGTALLSELEAAGATVLEEEYVDVDINGAAIRLGGMYNYAFGNNPENGENESACVLNETGEFLKEFQNTERLKIMMAHRPDSFIFGDASSYWDVDLVVSGHNQGGQVVVPFLGGLYGGDQGFFPEYVHGMYQKDQMNLFVTSGLGSNRQKLPRFNNPPEIAVVTIKAE